MSSRFELIVFDLDGTLVDSAPDIAFAVNSMLAELNQPQRSVEEIRHFLGNGVEWLTKRALTGEMWAEPDSEILAQARDRLLFHYGQINGDRTTVYPGVMEFLQEAKAVGIKLACLTNKNREFTEPLLRSMGLEAYFTEVVCGNDLPERKPDPLPLKTIMQRAGITEAKTMMVGDSITDVKTARAANAAVAAVSYGYNHGENIADAKPDWVIDSMLGIRNLL